MKKLTNDEVVERLRSIYRENLDYSKVLYINSRTPITLICPIHGEFLLYANSALLGRGGCPKCKLGIATLEEFIAASKEHFRDKFTYEKVKFKNLSEKVIITCPIHGDFEVVPRQFLQSKYGCSKCYYDSRRINEPKQLLTAEEKRLLKQEKWIKECKIIHNNKYDYSKVVYNRGDTKVCIICPEHGEFWQTPTSHKLGRGCPKCAYKNLSLKLRISLQEFERRANEKWNNRYVYGTYKGMHQYIEVTCPEHGVFYVTPHNHLVDCGCPECSKSSGEILVSLYLKERSIPFISLYQIPIDKSINPSGIAKIDFYLSEHNIFIEYNGILHYIPQEYFGGEIKFNLQILRDNYVRNYCKEHLIKLIEIPYDLNTELIYNKLNKLINNDQVSETSKKA